MFFRKIRKQIWWNFNKNKNSFPKFENLESRPIQGFLELLIGIEPITSALPRKYSLPRFMPLKPLYQGVSEIPLLEFDSNLRQLLKISISATEYICKTIRKMSFNKRCFFACITGFLTNDINDFWIYLSRNLHFVDFIQHHQ